MEYAKFGECREYLDEAFGAVDKAVPFWRRMNWSDEMKVSSTTYRGVTVSIEPRTEIRERLASLTEQLQLMKVATGSGFHSYNGQCLSNSGVFGAILDGVEENFP